ncbi:hypothetical protein BDK51DRAFT_20716 [Blyttiomyces helicus]|uniref:MPN domain-containing protein n=1 Tax=Blyttiomyces helicus TaxID=388810 RepID=A0A4P9WEZ3_9FUNG|nr:hypothetical protein BDK51DRAFT_20716 [Blyttiomyces helicus]|eukprot:RKO90293.1 hypothetical protein BDK51DRAFT_20716 [Blyttiomyces helicus]
MVNHSLDDRAYLKLILHAAKFSVNPVCGLLVGKKSAEGNLVVEDSIPLFHSTPLSPTLAIALQQTATYCSQTGTQIVGFYCANELASDLSISPSSGKIASKIDEMLGGASLLLLLPLATLFAGTSDPLLLQLANSSTPLPLHRLSASADIKEVALRHITDRTYASLHDFDSHLDNTSLDWLFNAKVTKAIQA